MQLQLNGELRDFDAVSTVGELIEALGLRGKRIAVELNEQIVPRTRHDETLLSNGDSVEIVHAIGGG